MSEPQFWLDDEDGTVWTWGPDSPQEMDNEEMVTELNKLAEEVERLRADNKALEYVAKRRDGVIGEISETLVLEGFAAWPEDETNPHTDAEEAGGE